MKFNYLVFSLSLLHMFSAFLQSVLTVCFPPSSLLYFFIPPAGKMKGLAFIQDPDGYWIEILSPNNMVPITS